MMHFKIRATIFFSNNSKTKDKKSYTTKKRSCYISYLDPVFDILHNGRKFVLFNFPGFSCGSEPVLSFFSRIWRNRLFPWGSDPDPVYPGSEPDPVFFLIKYRARSYFFSRVRASSDFFSSVTTGADFFLDDQKRTRSISTQIRLISSQICNTGKLSDRTQYRLDATEPSDPRQTSQTKVIKQKQGSHKSDLRIRTPIWSGSGPDLNPDPTLENLKRIQIRH